ncbi:hypothetical protein GCM10009006_29540 [Haloarcula argentinensis]|uniref:Uncharacterized protein n=2 Tax=Haloarcula argentinensis TaxID=43776 RepID=A0A830FKG3_HALAR|nr:hypothetical protein GCM10009006_29540 [Haloarcula argentinensis]
MRSVVVVGIVVISSVFVHDIAEVIDEHSNDDEEIVFRFERGTVIGNLVRPALLIYAVTLVSVPIAAGVRFYHTYNIYLGAGLFLYTIWCVKMLSPVKKYQM